MSLPLPLRVLFALCALTPLLPASRAAATPDASTPAFIETLLAQMTPEEKAGQLRQLNYTPGPESHETARDASRAGTAGAFVGIGNIEILNELQSLAVEESRLRIPLLFGFNMTHGYRTVHPIPLAQACTWNPALVEAAARHAAIEASSQGIRWTLAPSPELSTATDNPADTFGSSPLLASRLRAAMTLGLQGKDLSAPDHIAAAPALLAPNPAAPAAISDDEVRRVLQLKQRLGLFANPYVDPNKPDVMRTPEHQMLAINLATQSLVLLKNENRLLPLTDRKTTFALIGPFIDDADEMHGNASPLAVKDDCRTLKFLIEDYFFPVARVTCVPALSGATAADTTGFDAAVAAAAKSDVAILCLGETRNPAPGTPAQLPPAQEKLLAAVAAAGKPVVLVVFSGRPLDLTRAAPHARAVICAWQPGTMAGIGLWNILLGHTAPSGKLAAALPGPGAAWPFGHGLTYTNFTYSDLKIEPPAPGGLVIASATLANAGDRDGEEIVQLYTRPAADDDTAADAPQLRDFQRIALKAGEKKTVTFGLRPADLGAPAGPQRLRISGSSVGGVQGEFTFAR